MATVFQGGIWKMTIAWAITGCGHYLTQVMAILAELPGADVFLSRAAEEVLTIYNHDIDTLVRSGKKAVSYTHLDVYKRQVITTVDG